MRKQRDAARAAWEAALKTATDKANELEAKGEAVTAEDRTALDDLIRKAVQLKADFDRLDALVKQEDEAAEAKARADREDESAGRKTRDGAPAILPEGTRNQSSRGLRLVNIWKATHAAGAGQNPAVIRKIAGEEMDVSDRLLAAGYPAETLGGVLFPLAEELLVEPADDRGLKLADFTGLRKELSERLTLKLDPGELAWTLKRFPELASNGFGLERKDLALGDDTLGGQLVPLVQSGRIIDLLRARATLVRAGAQEIGLPPQGNLAFPRLTADPSFTYTDPDSTTDMSTSNIGTGVVRLMAKSLRGAVTIPNDLLRYSSPSVEMVVRGALASKSALAEDNAFIEGVGSSVAPKGLTTYAQSAAETPTTGRITLHVANTTGTNGDTFDPEDVNKIQGLFWMANDPDGPTGWILRPMMWAAINNRRADAVSANDKKGPFVFNLTRSINDGPITGLNGVNAYPTTQATNNRVKGSGTNLTYIIFGNFRRCIIGRVGVVELAVSEHVKFLQDKTIIRAILRNDMGLEHEESFVFTDTLLEA